MVKYLNSMLRSALLAALMTPLFPHTALPDDMERFLERPVSVRDETLYISADHVSAMLAEGERLRLIDVRPVASWRGTHIPGSIRMSMHEIKMRKGMRSETIILIGQGWNDRRLERVCLELLEKGFAVLILDGGINGWMAAEEMVSGTGIGRSSLKKIAAAEYVSVRADEDRVSVEPVETEPGKVMLHIGGGSQELVHQLLDMQAMEHSQTRVIQGPGQANPHQLGTRPCSSCP